MVLCAVYLFAALSQCPVNFKFVFYMILKYNILPENCDRNRMDKKNLNIC